MKFAPFTFILALGGCGLVHGETPLEPRAAPANKEAAEQVDKAIVNARPVFKPCVFSGETFPKCSFDQSADAEKFLGKCVLTPTFYNAEYAEVKMATKPGRYGAIIEVTTAGGRTFKRFATLYRTSQNLNWRSAKIRMPSIEFPPELGLDPSVVAERANSVADLFQDEFQAGMNRGSGAAVLFAGLSEMKAGAAPSRSRNGPYALDQAWWYQLKKRTGNLRADYYVHLPAGYDEKAGRKWPLILFLHGSGERGYDLELVKKNGLTRDLESKPDFPFIVIAPQCSPGEWWSPSELNDLLDRVEAKYTVDTDRVYLTGLSMGGYASWDLAIVSPERFAAVVPVCGGGDPADVERIKNVPLWVFHGGKDDAVPIQRSQEMVDALKKIGGNVKFTIFPEAKHDSWTQAYAMPELYEWLLQQHRASQSK